MQSKEHVASDQSSYSQPSLTHTLMHAHLLSHVMMMSLIPSPVKSATTGCCTGWQGRPNSDVVPPSSDCNMVAISQPTTRTCVCTAGGTNGREREREEDLTLCCRIKAVWSDCKKHVPRTTNWPFCQMLWVRRGWLLERMILLRTVETFWRTCQSQLCRWP